MNCHTDVVKALVEAGADIEATNKVRMALQCIGAGHLTPAPLRVGG